MESTFKEGYFLLSPAVMTVICLHSILLYTVLGRDERKTRNFIISNLQRVKLEFFFYISPLAFRLYFLGTCEPIMNSRLFSDDEGTIWSNLVDILNNSTLYAQ